MKELQGILKRDVSVVSRLASIGEMNAERKTKCITASLTPYYFLKYNTLTLK
jgi:hypothetical protein